MIDYVKHLSANRIIGDLIGREKYRFVDRKVIASVVDDVMEIVKSAAGSKVGRQTATNNQSVKPASYWARKGILDAAERVNGPK